MNTPHRGPNRRTRTTLLLALAILGTVSGTNAAQPIEQRRYVINAGQSTDPLMACCCGLSLLPAPAAPELKRNEPIGDLSDGEVGEVIGSGAPTPLGVVTASAATVEMLSVSQLNVPEANPVRSTARLTVPPRAQWQTDLAGDAFSLALETGSLRVSVHDGRARIARAIEPIFGTRTLDEIAPGAAATMWAGDRLVIHGIGSLVVHSIGEMAAISTISCVATPR